MSSVWKVNIQENLRLVQENRGPSVFIAVTGSEKDRNYWQKHFEDFRGELFRIDKSTKIVSVAEVNRKGNFLGMLNAWNETKKILSVNSKDLPSITLMSMIFGKGQRFSPFTQSLGNRKSAFPLPYNLGERGRYLCTADLSCLYTNLWVEHLSKRGFQGVIVKWGDEAVIPGHTLSSQTDFSKLDGVRFVWKRSLSKELVRDKEWILVESASGSVRNQLARSTYKNISEKINSLPERKFEIGVNLGSLAISYDFLDIAVEVFQNDIADNNKWVDWDPYVWIAFHCTSYYQWIEILEDEKEKGLSGLRETLERYPDLYEKISEVKIKLEKKNNRQHSIYALDFGEPYWADFGLHHSLRKQLEFVLEDSEMGVISRKLFQIPESIDANGNRIIRSSVPPDADIKDSIILDSIITDSSSQIYKGLVVGGSHGKITMPEGGSVLFCVADDIIFEGPHGIAYGTVGGAFSIAKGGRHTTLPINSFEKHLMGNESLIDLKNENYEKAILDNEISYAEAEMLMSEIDPQHIDLLRDKYIKENS